MITGDDFRLTFDVMLRLGLSFAFFVGIMLVVSQDAVQILNRDLQRELGLKKRLVSKIEDRHFTFIDRAIFRFRYCSGLSIAITAFLLLLMFTL